MSEKVSSTSRSTERLSKKEKKQLELRKHLMKALTRKKEGGYTKEPTAAQYAAFDPKRTTKDKKKSLKIKDD